MMCGNGGGGGGGDDGDAGDTDSLEILCKKHVIDTHYPMYMITVVIRSRLAYIILSLEDWPQPKNSVYQLLS